MRRMEKPSHEKTLRTILNLEHEFNSLLGTLEYYIHSSVLGEDQNKIKAWIQKLCAHCCAFSRRYKIKSFQKRNLYIAMLLKNVIKNKYLGHPFNKLPGNKEIKYGADSQNSISKTSNSVTSSSSLESLTNDEEIAEALNICRDIVKLAPGSKSKKYFKNGSIRGESRLKVKSSQEVRKDDSVNTLKISKQDKNGKGKHGSCPLSPTYEVEKTMHKNNHSTPDARATTISTKDSSTVKLMKMTDVSRKQKGKMNDNRNQNTSSKSHQSKKSTEIKYLYRGHKNKSKLKSSKNKGDAQAYLLQDKMPHLAGGKCVMCTLNCQKEYSPRNKKDAEIQTICAIQRQTSCSQPCGNSMDNGTQCYSLCSSNQCDIDPESQDYSSSSGSYNYYSCEGRIPSESIRKMCLGENIDNPDSRSEKVKTMGMCLDNFPRFRRRRKVPCIITLAKDYENKFPNEPETCDNTSAVYCNQCKQCAVIRSNGPTPNEAPKNCDCNYRISRGYPVDSCNIDTCIKDPCEFLEADISNVRFIKNSGGVILVVKNKKCALAFQDVVNMCSVPKLTPETKPLQPSPELTNIKKRIKTPPPSSEDSTDSPSPGMENPPGKTKVVPLKAALRDKKKKKKLKDKKKEKTKKAMKQKLQQSSGSSEGATESETEGDSVEEAEDATGTSSGSTAASGTLDGSNASDSTGESQLSIAMESDIQSDESTKNKKKRKGNLKKSKLNKMSPRGKKKD